MLYKSFKEFMNIFWREAHANLNLYVNEMRDKDWFGQVRESHDGVKYGVWARILHEEFPLVEIISNELEERTPDSHPDEWYHKAG